MTILHDEPKNVIYGLYCVCDDCLDKPELIRYVGQTTMGISERFNHHKYDAKASSYNKKYDLAVYRWMRKHGIEDITYKILQVLDSPEELNNAEIFWIQEFDTFKSSHGLNLSIGGSSITGYKHSEESRKKMSDVWKMTEARRTAMRKNGIRSNNSFSKSVSKINESIAIQIKKELWNGEPVVLVADMFGVSKSLIGSINTNRNWKHVPWPIGPRQRMRTKELKSKNITGRKHSNETREKISESAKHAAKHRVLP